MVGRVSKGKEGEGEDKKRGTGRSGVGGRGKKGRLTCLELFSVISDRVCSHSGYCWGCVSTT